MNDLSREHYDILDHTANRTANVLFWGDSTEMQELCEMGLMRPAGKVSFIPDPAFTITRLGREYLKKWKNQQGQPRKVVQ